MVRQFRPAAFKEVGKLADLAVLDRDGLALPDEEIKDIQVQLTIVGGRLYDSGSEGV